MNQLIGRSEELARVADCVGRLPASGGALVILGDAGIGKTALADIATELAALAGTQVAKTTGTEAETRWPYAALEQIFHPFADRMASMRTRPRHVLGRAFGWSDGETPDVFAVGIAALEALTDIAADSGLLLVVDDAQWVDDSSARVLAFLARRLADAPVLALLLLRTGHPSPVLTARLPVMELGRLSDEAADELLRVCRPALTSQDRQRILRHASGHPLGLIELSADFDGSEDQTLHARLQAVFTSRIRAVTPGTRTLLLAAALNDSDAVHEVEAAGILLGLGRAEVQAALREFAETGAVEVRAGYLVFRHPLVRSAIVSSADVAERRRIHGALATVLPTQSDRTVWHRAASVFGTDEAIAVEVEEAAVRAEGRGSIPVAFRAWTRAAQLSENDRARTRRILRAAESAIELGLTDHALGLVRGVDPDALDTVEQARLALVGLAADSHAAHPRHLRAVLAQADLVLDMGEVDVAVALALTVAENLDSGGRSTLAELTALGHRIAAALPDTDPRGLAVLATSDPVTHSGAVAQAILALDPVELNERSELLLRMRLNVDADPVLARMQRRLLDSYRSRGRLRSIVFLQPIHAWNEICLADWPEALRAAEEGTRLAVELGLPRWGTGTLIAQGHIAALHGDHERADDFILEAEQGAAAAGANNVLTGIQLTKGVNYLAQGRYDEAFAALRRPFDPRDPSHHPIQSGWNLGDLAEAAAHLGRVDEIRPLFQEGLDAAMTPWRTMAQQYAQPFLAGESGAVEAAFAAALDGIVADWPTYRARLLIEYGSWLRRQRRLQEARDRLRTGRDLVDALAMRPWSDRARSELRALGADSPPRSAGAWESLSAQELEVAQLAAQGLSNREIGERLFLSHRTVGSHLYRIFPKLAVTNRAQLAAALRP